MTDRLQIRATTSHIRHRTISLFAFKGQICLCPNEDPAVLSWQEVSETTETPEFACISKDTAQILMDDLWTCGIRPTEGQGSAGAMAAVQEHLKDLRKLVFDKQEPKHGGE